MRDRGGEGGRDTEGEREGERQGGRERARASEGMIMDKNHVCKSSEPIDVIRQSALPSGDTLASLKNQPVSQPENQTAQSLSYQDPLYKRA